ncbi:unnamed protein product [Ectocarpus sp. 12 AP-2014]
MAEIDSLFSRTKQIVDEKVAIADQTHQMVADRLKRLTTDLASFEQQRSRAHTSWLSARPPPSFLAFTLSSKIYAPPNPAMLRGEGVTLPASTAIVSPHGHGVQRPPRAPRLRLGLLLTPTHRHTHTHISTACQTLHSQGEFDVGAAQPGDQVAFQEDPEAGWGVGGGWSWEPGPGPGDG